MRHIDFFLSHQCMSDCIFCNYTDKMEAFRQCPYAFEEVSSILRRRRRQGFDSINFTGGEPTLHPHFVRILRLAKGLGMKVTVGSNMFKFSDESFFRETAPFIDEIVASVNAADPDHDFALTRSREGFERLCTALERFEQSPAPTRVVTNTVLTKKNIGRVEEILRFIGRFSKVKGVIISNVSPEGNALTHYEEITPTLTALRETVDRIARLVSPTGRFLRFFAIPLCILNRQKVLSNDFYYSPRLIVEKARKNGKVVSMEFKIVHYGRFMKRTARCRDCMYHFRGICGGTFVKYARLYGDNELSPIRPS